MNFKYLFGSGLTKVYDKTDQNWYNIMKSYTMKQMENIDNHIKTLEPTIALFHTENRRTDGYSR